MSKQANSGRRARRRLTGLVVASLALGGVAVATGAASASAATRTDVVQAAAHYATSRGYHIGVAVLDTQTGAYYGAGDDTGTFASESVVKAFIATRLLATGQMHGSVKSMAWKMITQSDDAMASALYGRVGGDGLINWVKQRYHLWGLGSPPRLSGWWGNTHITAHGMVHFYAHVKADPAVGPWLMHAMHSAHEYGSDGFYQFFGLPSATTHAAVKQGWGCDYDDFCTAYADENSTGFVNDDRYTVALLARGPMSSYGGPISALLTGVARTLLPHGQFPGSAPAVTGLHRHYGTLHGGGSLVVYGSGFDHVTRVMFGSVQAPYWHALSQHRLQVTVPKHDGGLVNIRVTTPGGTSHDGEGAHFRFVPAPRVDAVSPDEGSPAGGATLTVTGVNFRDVRQVLFGTTPAKAFRVDSTQQLTLAAPAHSAGRAHIVVVTAYGTASHREQSYYRFVAHPAVHAVAPDRGPAGTTVTLSGANFRSVQQVVFGTAVASFHVVSPTVLTVVAPEHDAGPVRVYVTSGYGTSGAAAYTYTGGA